MRISLTVMGQGVLGIGLAIATLGGGIARAADSPNELPIRFGGHYAFQGRIRLHGAIENRKINAWSLDAETRADDLRGQGFSCASEGDTWINCEKFHDHLPLPASIARTLRDQYQGKLSLVFPEVSNPERLPSLVSDSDLTQQWKVHQKVILNGVSQEKFEFVHNSRAGSIRLNEQGHGTWLRIEEGKSVAFGYPVSVTTRSGNGAESITYNTYLELER